MTRLLLALSLCLCLAIVPAAAAEDDAPADDTACVAETAPDGCEPPAGEDENGCEPDAGDDPAGEGEEEPGAEEGEDDPAGEDGYEDEEEGAEEEDELGSGVGEPQAEAETAPPAPGYRDFCDAPVFDRGFLRRNWRFNGESAGFADGVLSVTVASLPRVPRRLREQAGRLAGLEFAVVVGRRTKLSRTRTARGAKRGGSRRVGRRALDRARRVKVEGKFLPPSRWRRDADGLRVPTVAAKRVTVLR